MRGKKTQGETTSLSCHLWIQMDNSLFLCLVITVLVCLVQESKADGRTAFFRICTRIRHDKAVNMVISTCAVKEYIQLLHIVNNVWMSCLVLLLHLKTLTFLKKTLQF